MSQISRNPDFDIAEFSSEYWQQKPLLIKNFFSDFSDPIEAEELAGLALEQDVESRLVCCQQHDYQLSHGPFEAELFQQLPEQDWTLLVQAVDQYAETLDPLKQAFNFIPNWRVDDIMVSYAKPGGSVGPHFDHYDVFLIQGAGSRRWRLGQTCSESTPIDQSSGLKLLTEFNTNQEFTLECGDILYIPPGIAHWGIGEQAGLCYSVGFRGPSQAELIEAFSDQLMAEASEFDRYRDSKLEAAGQPGEINPSGLEEAWQTVHQALASPAGFYRGFGRLVTQPRYPERILSPQPLLTVQQVAELLQSSQQLSRHPGSRFAWLRPREESEIQIFADGELHSQPRENLQAVISLCDVTIDNISEIAIPENQDAWVLLVTDLLNQGSLLAD